MCKASRVTRVVGEREGFLEHILCRFPCQPPNFLLVPTQIFPNFFLLIPRFTRQREREAE